MKKHVMMKKTQMMLVSSDYNAGMSVKDIIAKYGINEKTVYRYKKEYPMLFKDQPKLTNKYKADFDQILKTKYFLYADMVFKIIKEEYPERERAAIFDQVKDVIADSYYKAVTSKKRKDIQSVDKYFTTLIKKIARGGYHSEFTGINTNSIKLKEMVKDDLSTLFYDKSEENG